MFKFSLQSVLEQRLAQEEKRHREFALARQEMEAHMGRERTVEREIARSADQVRQRQRDGMRLAEREIHERWIEAQRGESKRLRGERVQLERRLEERRRRLAEAVRERKVMEKLREREYAAYRREEAKAERKVFDEIAVRDYNRQLRWAKDSAPKERIAS